MVCPIILLKGPHKGEICSSVNNKCKNNRHKKLRDFYNILPETIVLKYGNKTKTFVYIKKVL